MARRRKRGLEKLVADEVKDQVEEVLGERLSGKEGEVDVETGEIQPGEHEEEEDLVLKRLISAFPSSEGYYGKLYKILPSGKEEMVHSLSALEDLNDPELEVAELAKERKWGSGSYKLRIFRQGEPGHLKTLSFRLNIDEPIPISEVTTDSRPESLTGRIKEVGEVVSLVKELLPRSSSQPAGDPEKLGDTLARTFEAGVNAAKSAGAQNNNGSNQILQVVELLKSLGLVSKETPKQASLEETIERLTKLGLVKLPGQEEKKDDFWVQLVKLKEMGLVRMGNEQAEDPLKSVEKIKTLIELVTPLVAGGAVPEKTSFAVKAVEVIGPYLPKIIGDITSAIKDVAEVSRMKLSNSLGGGMPISMPARKPISSADRPNPNQPINSQEPSPPSTLHPIFIEIKEAVSRNDASYFPKLKEVLIAFAGANSVEALEDGTLSIDTFMDLANPYIGGVLEPKEAKNYLQGFIDWLRSVEREPGEIIGVCKQCSEEYSFPSRESFENGNRICDVCKGPIEERSPTSEVQQQGGIA